MAITRLWLDWNEPCLPATAQHLIDQSVCDGHVCAMDQFICVTSGKRAGRLLLEQLLRVCGERGLHLVPPRTITPGLIIDTIAQGFAHGRPRATPDEAVMAWVHALRHADPSVLAPLTSNPPPHEDVLAWYELAETIDRLQSELAGQSLSFDYVAHEAETMELFSEAERWRALQKLHDAYTSILNKRGLADEHAARADALRAGNVQGEVQLVLVGIVELNAMQAAAVRTLAIGGGDVAAFVHAPESYSDRFDELGCVKPEAWVDAELELDDDQIIVADGPHDQAQATLHRIADFDGRYAAEQITIGLGDSALSNAVEHAAAWAELPVHAAEGESLSQTLPYRLLESIAAWLSSRRFADFAALLRHPDLERWLQQRFTSDNSGDVVTDGIGDWIALLDQYFADHLHERLSGTWLGKPERQQRLKAVYDAVCELLAPLDYSEQRPLGQWSEPVLSVLRSVYGSRSQCTYFTREACMTLLDVLERYHVMHEELQPSVNAHIALRLTLRAAANATLAEPADHGRIEMLGWLELHMDPAPALVMLGVNDGHVPESITADSFLPDGLRSRLGLIKCSNRRYARDAYLMHAISHSRESLTLIAGRRAVDGEPLTPSRLLLACKAEQLPQRVKRLCDADQAQRWPMPLGAPSPREQCLFVPSPQPPSQINLADHYMRVTDFRTYLSCPYRYWLSRIERLDVANDDGEEMDPMSFGSLAHTALERFGRDEAIRDSADAEAIFAVLTEHLDDATRRMFGSNPPPAVRVQLARLKLRLESFARYQAALRADGWVIQQCEYTLPEATYLDIPGEQPIRISGKIDRIDWHEATGTYRLIDYKTSESGATPFEVHHGAKKYKEGCWLDLQLPLYHFLAAQHGMSGKVEVGYIVLPKKASDVAYLAGPWTDEQLAEAVDCARDVVRGIRAGRFEPNPDFKSIHDNFATICRTNILGGDDDDEGDE